MFVLIRYLLWVERRFSSRDEQLPGVSSGFVSCFVVCLAGPAEVSQGSGSAMFGLKEFSSPKRIDLSTFRFSHGPIYLTLTPVI